MKRILGISASVIALCAMIGAAVNAGEQVARQQMEEGFYNFVTSGGHVSQVYWGRKPKGGVALAAVTAAGDQVKAYAASAAFRAKWAEFAKNNNSNPQPPLAMRPIAQLRLQNGPKASDVDKQMQQALDSIKNLPPDMQAQARAQIEQARKQMQQQQKNKPQPQLTDEQLLAQEKHRYDQDQKKYEEALAMQTPGDPNAAIKKALRTALEETAGVDYDAKLDRGQFVNPAYQNKDESWKMAYRAGRTATEGARVYAQKWLAELK